MTRIPHNEEPQEWSGHDQIPTNISNSTKSKLKSFFQWHKNSNDTLRLSTRASNLLQGDALHTTQKDRRPSPVLRAFSENTSETRPSRLHSSDGHRSRKRERILTDPPPLAQAYRQALIHAALATPESFVELTKSRQNSFSAQEFSKQVVLEDAVQVRCAHKKTESGTDTCNTKPKTFMLIHGPYLLQFPSEAEPNTLPEKILVLDKECVAFACDAVLGRPWVLQVSKTSSHSLGSHEKPLRPSWSRLTLRQPEDKRTVSTMLVVFDDSEELYTWLFAIRKEIEHLGGLEYRPDTEHDDQSWRDDLKRTFDSVSQTDTKSSKRSSPGRTVARHELSPSKEKNLHEAKPMQRPQSHESVASSKNTATSLDGLRDSLTSNGYSSTQATNSVNGSVPSTSPTTGCFPSIESIADTVPPDLTLRSFSRSSGSPGHRSKSQTCRSSILERRKLSVNSLTLVQPDSTKSWRVLTSLPSTISVSSNDGSPRVGSLPAMPPLLASQCVSSPVLGNPALKVAIKEASPDDRLRNEAETPSRKLSLLGTPGPSSKPKYSLFPVRSVPETKDEPLASPTIFVQPATRPKSRSRSKPTNDEGSKDYPRHRKSRSKTVTLELRQHRKSALLGLGQFDKPLRSPAVTDDMIMSNFGVKTKSVPLSPMPNSTVPGLADLSFGLDFLKTPYENQLQKHTPEIRRASSAKSISSIQSDGSSAFAKVPAGPPPAGPLPAIPTGNPRDSRASRTSQYSQCSQTSRNGNRRSNQRVKSGPTIEKLSVIEPCRSQHITSESITPISSSSLNDRHMREASPPAYVSKQSFEDSEQRARSRSRARRKSTTQRS